MFAASMSALAQPTVTGVYPANGSTNVALQTTIKIWFSSPLDTTKPFNQFGGYMTSIDNIISQSYSANSDTMYLNVSLASSKAYFIVVYWAPGLGEFSTPYGYEITTGASFTGTTVSGTVTSGSAGVTGANALVGLSDTPLGAGQPHMVAGTVSDGLGNFTIPYVPNGTLYPVAAKDVNADGQIDPGLGDAIGVGGAINVTGSPMTGLSLVLTIGKGMTYMAALDSANAFRASHLPGSVLRRIVCYRADSTGSSLGDWQFYYFDPALDSVTQVNVQSFGSGTKPIDYWTGQAIPLLRTITNPGSAASSAIFTANCEAQGGSTFRNQSVPGNWTFFRTLQLGQLYYSNIPYQYVSDTTGMYWMAQYHFDTNVTQNSSQTALSMWFIGDFSTGAIISTAGVDPSAQGVPSSYSLDQNYPNPFNPSTTIGYSLPTESRVTLDVYNLLGQRVAALVNGELSAGQHTALWKASVASGIYLYKLNAVSSSDPSRAFTQVRKMILMK